MSANQVCCDRSKKNCSEKHCSTHLYQPLFFSHDIPVLSGTGTHSPGLSAVLLYEQAAGNMSCQLFLLSASFYFIGQKRCNCFSIGNPSIQDHLNQLIQLMCLHIQELILIQMLL